MTKYQVLIDSREGSQLIGNAWEPKWYTATVTVCDTLEDAELWVSRFRGPNPQIRNPRIRTIE